MIFFPDPTIDSVGLDISDHVLRLIDIRKEPFHRSRLQLYRYAEERIPDGLLNRGEIKDMNAVVGHLKKLVKKAYGRRTGRGVVVSLPETRTFVKVITVKNPQKPEDLPVAVLSEAELHIPSPLADIYIDWEPLTDPRKVEPGKPLTVTIGAAPKTIVDSYSSAIEAAGLIPAAFEIEAQAIVRSVIHRPGPKAPPADEAVGIIDFGATRSSLIVYDRGTIQFTVSIQLSGDEVTKSIARDLKVSPSEAERTKRECGVDAHRCGTRLWSIMEPFLAEMDRRVKDACDFYREHFSEGRDLGRIVICGGGANMERIDELLSELAKTQVVKADPWVNIDPNRCPLPREIILSSTTAVGLALRHVFEGSDSRGKL